MNSWLDKLERKFGRYAISNLMYYLIVLYVIGFVVYTINPLFYINYLSLNPAAILHGQIWRIITFVALPPSSNLVICAILLFVYYMLGRQMEAIMGAFRFNVFIFQGLILHVLCSILVYVCTGGSLIIGTDTEFLVLSMFFLYALMFPDAQFMLYFAIPVKGKWLAWIDGFYFAYAILSPFLPFGGSGGWSMALGAFASLLNLCLFFSGSRNMAARKNKKRKKEYETKVRQARKTINYYENGARHKCAVCGRTELDDPNLEFRYCSRCSGNYEYCQDHLFTHTHVK